MRQSMCLAMTALLFLGCKLFSESSDRPDAGSFKPPPMRCEDMNPAKMVVECNAAGSDCRCIELLSKPRDLALAPAKREAL